MKATYSLIVFLSFLSFSIAQTDEINISASFAQSIELRVIGSSSVNFTFSTIADYTNGKWFADRKKVGFEVASSTSFIVQASFTPFTSAEGNTIELFNLNYWMGVEEELIGGRGTRWEFGTSDVPRYTGQLTVQGLYSYGEFVGSTTPKTIVTPAGNGNAGNFEENRFYIVPHIGYSWLLKQLGKPNLLDQNIQPGVYSCTMTLTAIPQAL